MPVDSLDPNESGEVEEFKPAFIPAEEVPEVAKDTETAPVAPEQIVVPPEFDTNPIGHEPTLEEIDAEVGGSHVGYQNMADARNAARSRLIAKANGEAVVEVQPFTAELAVNTANVLNGQSLEDYVKENELEPQDEAGLVAYANIVRERSDAQIAGDWNLERKKREEQKAALERLTDKAKPFSEGYAGRYIKDIRQKEAEAQQAA